MSVALSPAIMGRLDALDSDLRSGADPSALDILQALAATPSPQAVDAMAGALTLARAAFEAGYELAAVAALREAVQQRPEHGDAHFLLCALLLKRGDPDAGRVLGEGLARFPQPSAGWLDIAEVLLAKGQKAAALVCLGRGVPDAALSIRRGLLARDLGRLREARDAFADAVRRDPASPRALFLLGTAAQDLHDLPAAAAAYRAVLRLDPDRAEAAVNLGTVLQQAGDLAGAKAAYARALRSRPDSFARIAQALPSAPKGELWLDLRALRQSLAG